VIGALVNLDKALLDVAQSKPPIAAHAVGKEVFSWQSVVLDVPWDAPPKFWSCI
jgi:hypothetical protein